MEEHEETLIDRLRGSGVGVEDPNIVGEVGPIDIPPGGAGEGAGLLADPEEAIEPVDSVEPPDLFGPDPPGD
ncbi:MAG: hypothetical protein ACR2HM_08825 [Acidimicrobiales bacterium]